MLLRKSRFQKGSKKTISAPVNLFKTIRLVYVGSSVHKTTCAPKFSSCAMFLADPSFLLFYRCLLFVIILKQPFLATLVIVAAWTIFSPHTYLAQKIKVVPMTFYCMSIRHQDQQILPLQSVLYIPLPYRCTGIMNANEKLQRPYTDSCVQRRLQAHTDIHLVMIHRS